jgi:tetratricopeptide (TPR) repeat protein
MREPRRLAALLAAALLTGACASAPILPSPLGDVPVVKGAGEATQDERRDIEKGYMDLRRGRLSSALSRFRRLRERSPNLLAARTGMAYVRTHMGQYEEAERLFGEVLLVRPADLDALLGLGENAARRGDLGRAVQSYGAAALAHPGDPTARKRLADAKLRFIETRLAQARAAAGSGKKDAAEMEYRQALSIVPEVAGLRLELVDLLVARGDVNGAVEVLAADPTGDPQVLARLGEHRLALGLFEGAVEAYAKAVLRDPTNAELKAHLAHAQHAFDFSRMPEEYQRIFTATFITRADLAALMSVKVTALSRVNSLEPRVAVDISGSWAKDHILKALAFDIIDVYPNHTFQPAAMIRRGDLARAVARVLDLLRWPKAAAPTVRDMSSSHLYYEAAVRVVGAGLMDLTPEGAFEPGQRVSGPEAASVVEALSRLLGP